MAYAIGGLLLVGASTWTIERHRTQRVSVSAAHVRFRTWTGRDRSIALGPEVAVLQVRRYRRVPTVVVQSGANKGTVAGVWVWDLCEAFVEVGFEVAEGKRDGARPISALLRRGDEQ
jgi:hypothetical protein